MNNLFSKTSSHWVRYSDYEWKADTKGTLYLTPTGSAKPEIYDPIKESEILVLEALNVGKLCMSKSPDEDIKRAVLQFALQYGLFGLMTALPTTTNFMDYTAVYLPKNNFIKDEMMKTEDYLDIFFPFEKADVVKNGIEAMWNISGDKAMMALAMTMSDKPMAVNMSFQREYAESFEWLKQQFTNWFFTFTTSVLYYEDYDSTDEDTRNLYRQSMATFDGIAPTYHIALLDRPTIVWDFHSLLLGIQMMFSFMLTEDKKPLKICRHCNTVFVANRQGTVFCSPQCKNRYNVYKSRGKQTEDINNEQE